MKEDSGNPVDRLIEDVHAGAPPEINLDGSGESSMCLLVLAKGQSLLSVAQPPRWDEWSPEFVPEMADDLEDERIAELLEGAELNEDEARRWQNRNESEADYYPSVEVYVARHSERPGLRAYVVWHAAGTGQLTDELGWVGPCASCETIVPFVEDIAKT